MDKQPDDKPKVVTPKSAHSEVQHNASLNIVLQWLSYAFWGLLVGALMWLVVVVLNLAIRDQVFDNATPYALAAVVVLLPIAFVTDLLYRKREPAKKAGMAAVVMVIHAVLFALIAIGTLIGAVFTAIALLLSTESDTSVSVIILLSLLIAALLYALLFARILTPQRPQKFSFIVSIVLVVLSAGLFIWGVVGPGVQTMVRKDDRRIEQHISSVQSAVSRYARSEGKLPESLGDAKQNMSREARALVDDGLVTYRKEASAPLVLGQKPAGEQQRAMVPQQELRYQLCVTYKASSSNADRYYPYDQNDEADQDGYEPVIPYGAVRNHDKGETCYKVKVKVPVRLEAYREQEQR